jgi:alpha-D-ribose 1-methylphosphonate 5-triphosphate synthase subunit PhnH
MPGAAMQSTAGSAVFAAQSTFRRVMDAMARPGSIQTVGPTASAPAPLAAAAAAVALTLFDHDTPIWRDGPFGTDAVTQWLRFNTGCPIVADQAAAAFALAADMSSLPPLESFAQGTHDYPDRSTTLILQLPSLKDGEALTLSGPGIRGTTRFCPAGLPRDLVERLAGNRALFPRGVDLVLVAGHELAALPRTTIVARV